MPRFFTDNDGVDWIHAEDVEEEYTQFVKYIVVHNTGPDAFTSLEYEVNKFIDEAEDSFLISGPVQIGEHYLVQTLVNEDEM